MDEFPSDLSSSDTNLRQKSFDDALFPVFEMGDSKLVKRIGRGGYGAVYLLEKDGRQYAAKFVRPDEFDLEQNIERQTKQDFLGQRMAHALNSGVFVEPVGVLKSRGKVIGHVMEYIPGCKELRDYIITGERGYPYLRIPEGMTADFFTKLRNASNQVMDAGLMLTDFAPQNVLVDTTGNPRISDVQYTVNYNPMKWDQLEPDAKKTDVNSTIDFWERLYREAQK